MRIQVCDDWAPVGLVNACIAMWPDETWPHWHKYQDRNSVKYATKDADRLITPAKLLVRQMAAMNLRWYGFDGEGLFPDTNLHGAGMHWIPEGGHLSRHLDSDVHPLTGWSRRLNALLYLTECEGGALTFDGRVVAPKVNRMVIFETTGDAWHEVTPVRKGDRKAISMFWWSVDPSPGNRPTAQFADCEQETRSY